jgi:ABC-type transport system substrate-binding protein
MSYWDRTRRRQLGRRQVLIGASAGVAGFLIACGGNSSDESSTIESATPGSAVNTAGRAAGEEPKRGGTLRVGVASDPRSMDPHVGTGGLDHQRLYPTYDNLVTYDSKGQLDPSASLAEKWEQFDDRVVLTLRQGVKFQDGAPFTAEDVKWNLERQLDPATTATDRPNLLVIDRVEVTNPNEVVLRLKEPSAPLLAAFGERAGMMISRTTYEKIGKDEFGRRGVGTGPFLLKDWASDAFMTYERNPNYWRKDAQGRNFPYLQSIRIETMPDDTVRVAALESGDIDLIGLSTPTTEIERLNSTGGTQWAQFVGASTNIFYITHGLSPMNLVPFRKAVYSALDIPSFIRNFLTGKEPQAGTLIPPASWAHDPSIAPLTYDVARAKQYLSESGVAPADARIKVCINPPITQTNQFWETNWKDAGITTENIVEQGASLRYLYLNFGGNGTAHLHYSGYTLKVDPDPAITAFYTPQGSYNAAATTPPEIEQMVLKARRIFDQEERRKIYSDLQRRAADQVLSVIPVNYTIKYVHASKKVGNLENFFGGEGKDRYANLWI